MLVLFVLVVISGYWQDGLFVGVVLSNTVLGVSQEVQARRELAKLQVITAPKATVIRDGAQVDIASEDIVEDEIVVLAPGGQVPVDGMVLAATGLQLDESMLTGESVAVIKQPSDEVLSGPSVVNGSAEWRVSGVGAGDFCDVIALKFVVEFCVERELVQVAVKVTQSENRVAR